LVVGLGRTCLLCLTNYCLLHRYLRYVCDTHLRDEPELIQRATLH
jgi:hypothetical protein